MNNDIIKKEYNKRVGVTALKQFRKVISLILCMALAMSFSAMAVGSEEELQPYADFTIESASAAVSSSGSSFVIDFNIRASESCSKIGIDSIKVYDVTNRTSFTAAGTTMSGVKQYANSIYIPITKGHAYYANVKFVAQPSGGSAVYRSTITRTINT
jgi:hypothetical protein